MKKYSTGLNGLAASCLIGLFGAGCGLGNLAENPDTTNQPDGEQASQSPEKNLEGSNEGELSDPSEQIKQKNDELTKFLADLNASSKEPVEGFDPNNPDHRKKLADKTAGLEKANTTCTETLGNLNKKLGPSAVAGFDPENKNHNADLVTAVENLKTSDDQIDAVLDGKYDVAMHGALVAGTAAGKAHDLIKGFNNAATGTDAYDDPNNIQVAVGTLKTAKDDLKADNDKVAEVIGSGYTGLAPTSTQALAAYNLIKGFNNTVTGTNNYDDPATIHAAVRTLKTAKETAETDVKAVIALVDKTTADDGTTYTVNASAVKKTWDRLKAIATAAGEANVTPTNIQVAVGTLKTAKNNAETAKTNAENDLKAARDDIVNVREALNNGTEQKDGVAKKVYTALESIKTQLGAADAKSLTLVSTATNLKTAKETAEKRLTSAGTLLIKANNDLKKADKDLKGVETVLKGNVTNAPTSGQAFVAYKWFKNLNKAMTNNDVYAKPAGLLKNVGTLKTAKETAEKSLKVATNKLIKANNDLKEAQGDIGNVREALNNGSAQTKGVAKEVYMALGKIGTSLGCGIVKADDLANAATDLKTKHDKAALLATASTGNDDLDQVRSIMSGTTELDGTAPDAKHVVASQVFKAFKGIRDNLKLEEKEAGNLAGRAATLVAQIGKALTGSTKICPSKLEEEAKKIKSNLTTTEEGLKKAENDLKEVASIATGKKNFSGASGKTAKVVANAFKKTRKTVDDIKKAVVAGDSKGESKEQEEIISDLENEDVITRVKNLFHAVRTWTEIAKEKPTSPTIQDEIVVLHKKYRLEFEERTTGTLGLKCTIEVLDDLDESMVDFITKEMENKADKENKKIREVTVNPSDFDTKNLTTKLESKFPDIGLNYNPNNVDGDLVI